MFRKGANVQSWKTPPYLQEIRFLRSILRLTQFQTLVETKWKEDSLQLCQ